MTKEVPFTEIPIHKLSNKSLLQWANYLADGVSSSGTGWLIRQEIIRMAEEITLLRNKS